MKRNTVAFWLVVILASLGLVAGCSGIRAYPNTMEKNLFVDVEADSGVKVALHVYQVDKNCEASYKGTVFLNKERSEVGIPSGSPSYLQFTFARSSFLSGKSSTDYGTLLTPRGGKVYKVMAVYTDDMYNVEIREAKSLGAKGREVEYRDLDDCTPAK